MSSTVAAGTDRIDQGWRRGKNNLIPAVDIMTKTMGSDITPPLLFGANDHNVDVKICRLTMKSSQLGCRR